MSHALPVGAKLLLHWEVDRTRFSWKRVWRREERERGQLRQVISAEGRKVAGNIPYFRIGFVPERALQNDKDLTVGWEIQRSGPCGAAARNAETGWEVHVSKLSRKLHQNV